MLPGYDIMSQRLPSVTEAEASVQCLVSRGSLSPGQSQCPQVQLIGQNYTVTRIDNSEQTFLRIRGYLD